MWKPFSLVRDCSDRWVKRDIMVRQGEKGLVKNQKQSSKNANKNEAILAKVGSQHAIVDSGAQLPNINSTLLPDLIIKEVGMIMILPVFGKQLEAEIC
ncbi:hypothetical protein NPIL_362551 [Nephila pilipes]|uniref:Uncharacterized protein n=1 Tax=Nephila pilipes TaxID=299642 RepID=A0A8X6P1L6_NEPPI|nr:hypothetical protein NPIL_362551 [Nephila pilipes]